MSVKTKIQKWAVKSMIKDASGSNAGNNKNWFYPMKWIFNWTGNYRKIFEESAIISSVIGKRAQYFGNAVPYIKDKDGNEPEEPKAVAIRKLLNEPNKLMSFEQFYRAIEMFRMLYGYCIVFKFYAIPGAAPTHLYIIDPDQISIEVEKTSAYIGTVSNVVVKIANERTNIQLKDLIIFNDLKLGFGSNPLLAQSRMTAIKHESKLLAVIADAEESIIRNRGALGILSKDINDQVAPAVFEEKVEDLQAAFKRYGITSEQYHIIVTNAALKWQSMSIPLRELMLIEFEEQNAKKICGVFDLPYELLPMSGQSTYANRSSAEKEVYQNTVIPSSKSDAKILTKALCVGTNLQIELDYSDMYIFQENMSEKATATNMMVQALNTALNSGMITADESRKLLSNYVDIDTDMTIVQEQTILLAQALGVGGTQSLVAVVTDPNLSDEQKRGLLKILFNFTDEQAFEAIPETINNNNNNQNITQNV
jgi:phage portal protein BeeE